MRKINVKVIVALLVTTTLFVLLLFSNQILTYSFEKYLTHFARTSLNSELRYDTIVSSAKGWTFQNPSLRSKEGESGLDFAARSLTIHVIPHWLKREADIYVSLVGPQMDVGPQITEIGEVLLKSLTPVGFLHLRAHVVVQNGELRVQSGEGKETLFFDLDATKDKELQGHLSASFEDPELQSVNLKVQFSNPQKHSYFVDIDADEFKAPVLATFAKLLSPEFEKCEIKEGLLTGHLGIDIPRDGQPFASGDLTLKKVHFYHRSLEMKGQIQTAEIHIEENKDPRVHEGEFPRTIGHLELGEHSNLTFEKSGVPLFSLDDLKGTLYFQTMDGARLNLTAVCHHHNQTSWLKAQGLARFGIKDGNALDMSLQLQQSKEEALPATARFITRELGAKFKFAEMTFTNIGPEEFEFLQVLLSPHIPQLAQAHLISGQIDASVLAYIKGMQLSDFKIERLEGENLDFALDRWDTTAHIDSLSGGLEVNFASVNPLETLNADLRIAGGHFDFTGLSDTDLSELTNLQTDLIIRKGVIQDSLATAEFSGLKGTISLNGLDPEGEFVKIDFSGPFRGLAGIAPEKLRKALNDKWREDLLSVRAGIKKIEKGISVVGCLQIIDNQTKIPQQIDWNFELKRHQKDALSLSDRFWQGFVHSLWKKKGDITALQSSLAAFRLMGRQTGMGGFNVRNGHFKASGIALEKYIAPMLFDESPSELSGKGDFEGEFDQSGLSFDYLLLHAIYETPKMKWIVGDTVDNLENAQGKHYFDFASNRSFGQLALKNSLCHDKRLNLNFTNTDAQIFLADKQLRWENIKTESCGLLFEGEIAHDLRNPSPGYSTTKVDIRNVRGRFSQMQEFFNHYDNLRFFQKFPLEGEISLGEKGAHLFFNSTPETTEIVSDLQGSLRNGTIQTHSAEMQLDDLQFNFDYDQKTNSFLVKDIHAFLKIGETETEDYILSGDKIHFTNCDEGTAVFDLWLGSKTRDIVRIAGKTVPSSREGLNESLDLILDKKLTHFGDVHPERFELTFKDWNHVDYFHVDFGLSLATMLYDVQTLSRTGLLFLPKNLIAELNALKDGKGDFQASIDYDAQTSILNYNATASDVAVGDHNYHKCALQGKKKGSTWAIDQLLLDETSIAADLTRMPNSWKVNFIGLRVGQSLLVGLEGDYRDGDKIFEGKINLFEADLSKFHEWPALAKFQQEYPSKGTLRATGQIHLEPLASGKRNWKLELLLNGSLRNPEFRNLHFLDIPNLSIHFVTDRGLTVRGLHTALKEGDGPKTLGQIDIEKIDFDTVQEQLALEGLRFDFPVENLFFTFQRLRETFPQECSEEVLAIVSRLKDSNHLEGSIDFKKSKEGLVAELYLPAGRYRFNEQWHNVNNFKLLYDQHQLKILSQYRYNDYTFWMFIKTHANNLKEGIVLLGDHHPELQYPLPGHSPLKIDWKIDPEKGLSIQRAQGFLAGMEINLFADPDRPADGEAIYLSGVLNVNPSQAGCLISQAFADKCRRLQVGEGYALKGNWRLGKNSTLRFAGLLEGREFRLKGYKLQSLTANVTYELPTIQFSDLRIVDNAGSMRIERIQLTKEGSDLWKLGVPKIAITNFKPSLLRENGDPPKLSKPLLIRSLEIQNLTGYADEPETWTGKGTLQFSNPPKKNLQNTILAIPAEILTLIGLDLTVLNPVSGNILFDVREGKFVLTKFKDVYSEGRLSKFHLTHEKVSAVDFAGNVDVQIRMKQYNLFFKLAELLTFNIKGTLVKPLYSLNKQRKL